MSEAKQPVVVSTLRRWSECQQNKVRGVIDRLHPETRQVVDSIRSAYERDPDGEGAAMHRCGFRDGMRLGVEVVQQKLTPPQSPRGIALWIMCVRGYCEAAEETAGRIHADWIERLKQSPRTTTLPQNASSADTAS